MTIDSPSRPKTLPPPEWDRAPPASVAAVGGLLGLVGDGEPLPHVTGPRAELAHRLARLQDARTRKDRPKEREASLAVARWLKSAGMELDIALRLLRHARDLGDDQKVREEIIALATQLGQHGVAAREAVALAEQAAGREASRAYMQAGELFVRAGEAPEAREALRAAATLDAESPLPQEVLGSIAFWSRGVAEDSARAFLAAAQRRLEAKDAEGAMEDALRALEVAPGYRPAREFCVTWLTARHRESAADHLLFELAREAPEDAVEIHRRRAADALARGEIPIALAAALDAGLDAEAGGADAEQLDRTLERAGLVEWLLARQLLRAQLADGPRRRERFLELARTLAATVGAESGSGDALIEAVAADPSDDEARAALRAHAADRHDPYALVEGLLGGAANEGASVDARAACLIELCEAAEGSLADPSLAVEAVERLVALGARAQADLDAIRSRLAPRIALQDEALAQAGATPDAVESRRRVLSLLRGRPKEIGRAFDVALSLFRDLPEERGFLALVERWAARADRVADVVDLLEASARAASRGDAVRFRTSQIGLLLKLGDVDAAALAASRLLKEAKGHRAAAGLAASLGAAAARAELRIEALAELASGVSGELRAALLSTACFLSLDEGDQDRVRTLGRQAGAANPLSARAMAASMLSHAGDRDEAAVAARERAAGVCVPRAEACREQAAAMEALGEAQLALAWTERWFALRPADGKVVGALVRRAAALPDARKLADTCEWILTLPLPAADLAPHLAFALSDLGGRDPVRAVRLATRASERIGHGHEELSTAIVSVLRSSTERRAVPLAIERRLPYAAGEEKVELLLAETVAAEGSDELAARALLRAVREGAAEDRVRHLVSDRWTVGDAALARAEIDAELVARDPKAGKDAAVRFRVLGGLRFDLAEDPKGATRAWVRAAELDRRAGVGHFVADVVGYLPPDSALEDVRTVADQRKSPAERAFVLALLAQVAARLGRRDLAIDVASEAHGLSPSRTDLLALAEHLLAPPERLDKMYRLAAAAALGPFGRRAAHYRAARQLERRGTPDVALFHAALAFESVPTLGMPYVLMTRLAQRHGSPEVAVNAIERVAEVERDEGERSQWYHRAAGLLEGGEEGARRRVDVLVRAARAVPDRRTVAELGAALATLVAEHGMPAEEAQKTLVDLAREKMKSGEGPSGARVCLAFVRASLVSLDAHDLAAEALCLALKHDADLEDYDELVAHARSFVEAKPDVVLRCLEIHRKPYSNVGAPALKLAAAIAEMRKDTVSLVELLVSAARRAPDEDDLVSRAVELALAAGRDDLAKLVDDALPLARRAPALIRLAEKQEAKGDLPGAIAALEKARAGKPKGKLAENVEARLAKLYAAAGADQPLREQAERTAQRADLSPEEKNAAALEAARIADGAGDAKGAAQALLAVLRGGAGSGEILVRAVDAARRSGDDALLAGALEQSLGAPWATAPKTDLLRELLPLLVTRGQNDAARVRARELLVEAPDDREALVAVEQVAVAEGDHDLIVDALERRIALSDVEEGRVLRLRRAAVLEQRLGRLEDARRELAALVDAGEDPTALRFLADIDERTGKTADAAELWARLGDATVDGRDKTEHYARAAGLFVASGALEEARAVLEKGLATSRTERLLTLRVDVEKRAGVPRLYGDALDELAVSSMAPAEERAALLVAAAEQALLAEDSLGATARAQRAARIAPLDPKAQLLARHLEYRARGAGTPQEAATTLDELRRVATKVSVSDGPLLSFLLAEALDATSGGGAGMRELAARHAETGPHPLLALGMAERLVRSGSFEAALPLFDEALAGDLGAVRRRGQVAMAAAEASAKAGDPDRALRYLDEALSDPSTAAAARQRKQQLTSPFSSRSAEVERAELADLAKRAVGLDRARVLLRLARIVAREPGGTAEAEALLVEAHGIADLDRTLQVEIDSELAGLSRTPSARPPVVEETRPPSTRPTAYAPPVDPDQAPNTVAPPPQRITLATALDRALAQPGDVGALEALREAAVADRSYAHARAVEQVLAVFARTPSRDVPQLAAQREEPEIVTRLFLRGASHPLFEVVAHVWDHAPHLFRRDQSAYGVSGLDRVAFGGVTPAARTYTLLARMFGTPRTPLFQRRGAREVVAEVALLTPASVVLGGEPRDESPELAYRLGAALISATSDRALLAGLAPAQLQGLLTAIDLAFGPPRDRGRPTPSIAVTAEALWQALPARAQRRVGELSALPDTLSAEAAVLAAARVAARAGLFACGHLGVALREAARRHELLDASTLDRTDGLVQAMERPLLYDLYAFALSPEYAAARFGEVGRSPSGTMRAFGRGG